MYQDAPKSIEEEEAQLVAALRNSVGNREKEGTPVGGRAVMDATMHQNPATGLDGLKKALATVGNVLF